MNAHAHTQNRAGGLATDSVQAFLRFCITIKTEIATNRVSVSLACDGHSVKTTSSANAMTINPLTPCTGGAT